MSSNAPLPPNPAFTPDTPVTPNIHSTPDIPFAQPPAQHAPPLAPHALPGALRTPSNSLLSADERMQAVTDFYQQLTPKRLGTLAELYAPDASFKDPFNEVRGVSAIAQIFNHMFVQVAGPRFVVTHSVVEGDQGYLGWVMYYRSHATDAHEQQIRGCTHLRFDAQGRVAHHRDYWDAAEELYERVPLLGAVLRWLKRRLSASVHPD